MAFGPGGFVVRNWLDDAILSPWVSLTDLPSHAVGTVLRFDRFPGNFFTGSRLVHQWAVRGKKVVDGVECISAWGRASLWNSLSFFGWQTPTFDMTPHFDSESASMIQIRHRVSDWQLLFAADPPVFHNPGPGPYVDRTRIGRVVWNGPQFAVAVSTFLLDGAAQDGFASELNPAIPLAGGEHFRPTTDRFGTADFSEASQVNRQSMQRIVGDSIHVLVQDVRDAGGVVAVEWYGAIVSGPHRGKAPPPWAVSAHGFFHFEAPQALSLSGGGRLLRRLG